jgi:hypothetical protein
VEASYLLGTEYVFELALTLPAASNASTVYAEVLSGARPESFHSSDVVVPSRLPSR